MPAKYKGKKPEKQKTNLGVHVSRTIAKAAKGDRSGETHSPRYGMAYPHGTNELLEVPKTRKKHAGRYFGRA